MVGSPPPEPCRQNQATPTIDREVGPHTTGAQHQHVLTADGLDQDLSAEQMPCVGREGDASNRLHTDDPVPPLRYPRPAAQLGQERDRRSGRRPGGRAVGVFKRGRGPLSVTFRLSHRMLGWNPVNGVGGGT